jgi:hypothetical protein
MKPRLADSPMPRALARLKWWLAGAFGVVALMASVMLIPAARAWVMSALAPTAWGWVVPLAVFAPILTAVLMIARGQRRIARTVRATDGLSCADCLHDLRGTPSPGRCPECGTPFETHALRAMWARLRLTDTHDRPGRA